MRALTVLPGTEGSARLEEVAEPLLSEGPLLVRTRRVGVCGTDVEIVAGEYGSAPPACNRLILGHESLGEVVAAPASSGFAPGDLVAGIVRRPDPLPCASCTAGEWDMCRNGGYTERGIKARHGFASEIFRLEPEYAVHVDQVLGPRGVLIEPASVVAKAWEQIERIGHRVANWQPRRVLVTGAGPVGLLAALMGVQRGLDVYVFDRVTTGPKPQLVRDLGSTYWTGELSDIGLRFDVVVECTGAASVVVDAINRSASPGLVCLTGFSARARRIEIDVARLNRTMVLENDVVFGSVNANRRHYESAARDLSAADQSWLERLITRSTPLARWPDAFQRSAEEIKTVIDFEI